MAGCAKHVFQPADSVGETPPFVWGGPPIGIVLPVQAKPALVCYSRERVDEPRGSAAVDEDQFRPRAKVQNILGFQTGFFEELVKYLLYWGRPWLDVTTNAVPPAAVMTDPSVPPEKRDPPTPFDDGRYDDAVSRDVSPGVRLSRDSRGYIDDAHVAPYHHAELLRHASSRAVFGNQFRPHPQALIARPREGLVRYLLVWWAISVRRRKRRR